MSRYTRIATKFWTDEKVIKFPGITLSITWTMIPGVTLKTITPGITWHMAPAPR